MSLIGILGAGGSLIAPLGAGFGGETTANESAFLCGRISVMPLLTGSVQVSKC